MVYKADINELPLNVFIEVYTNENHGVKFDIPTEQAVSKIVGDYMNIVGGKQIAAEIVNLNRRINLSLMVDCMTACENLMIMGYWKGVCQALLSLGYSVKSDDHEKMKQRVLMLKSKAEYDLSKDAKEDKPKDRPTKETFTKERVMVMKYNKMQIDPKVMTAGEYAWLLKQTCDEIEELNRKHRK